jgi:hypothetical protein
VTEGLKAGFMWVDPSNPAAGQVKIPTNPNPTGATERERGAQIKQAIAAIQKAREQAGKNLAIGSASQFFQGTPVLNQNRLNIESTLRNAEAGIIQDMVRSLAEANQGGVSGMANTDVEARRMGAAIADLNPNQDLPSLMTQLDRAEDYYLRQAAMVEGKPEPDEEIVSAYLPPERQREIAARQPQQMELSSDGTKAEPIPQWYQDAVNRYLSENKGDLDPSRYAAFRLGLDEQLGIPGDLQYYVQDGQRMREGIAQGGNIAPIPGTREVRSSPIEQVVTGFAQTPLGAGTISF